MYTTFCLQQMRCFYLIPNRFCRTLYIKFYIKILQFSLSFNFVKYKRWFCCQLTLNAVQLQKQRCSTLSFNLVTKKEKCRYPKGCFGEALHFTAIIFLETLCTNGPEVSVANNQISCFISLFTFKDDKIEFLRVNG